MRSADAVLVVLNCECCLNMSIQDVSLRISSLLATHLGCGAMRPLLTAVTALLLLLCGVAGATSAADQAHYERALSTAIDEVVDWWLPEAEEDEEDRRGVAIEPFGDPDIADITDIADIPTLPTF